ncbi:MAG: hypothetical protein ACYTBJ_09800 [Planctomycetota bacterium]|jgi:hypothetical protein
MTIIFCIFAAHVVLLTLAATDFSIVSWLWGNFSWNYNYFAYSYRNGFGYQYVSDYSLRQLLAYLFGYGLGLPVFVSALKRQRMVVGCCGIILCGVGVVSFTIEASHWIWDHHLSLIASFPIVMFFLWIFWAVAAVRKHKMTGAPDNSLKPPA